LLLRGTRLIRLLVLIKQTPITKNIPVLFFFLIFESAICFNHKKGKN